MSPPMLDRISSYRIRVDAVEGMGGLYDEPVAGLPVMAWIHTQSWLVHGDVLYVTLVACNSVGLCDTNVSSPLAVDGTPPVIRFLPPAGDVTDFVGDEDLQCYRCNASSASLWTVEAEGMCVHSDRRPASLCLPRTPCVCLTRSLTAGLCVVAFPALFVQRDTMILAPFEPSVSHPHGTSISKSSVDSARSQISYKYNAYNCTVSPSATSTVCHTYGCHVPR